MTEREYLFQLAKRMQPGQRFLEIGVFGGTTLSMFAMLGPPGLEVIGMDSWENTTANADPDTGEFVDLRTFCVRNLQKNGVADRVTLVDGSSHAHGQLWTLPLDVLLVDGDHTYGGALQDLRDFASHVVSGGLLLIDDYWNTVAVREATERWLTEIPGGWVTEWGTMERSSHGDSKMIALRRGA